MVIFVFLFICFQVLSKLEVIRSEAIKQCKEEVSIQVRINSIRIVLWVFASLAAYICVHACVCVCVFRHPIFRSWTHHQTWTSADWGDSANGC